MVQELKKLSIGFLFDDTLDSNDGVAQQVKVLGRWFANSGYHVVYLCGETKLDNWAGGKVYSLAKNIRVRFNGNQLSMPVMSNAGEIKRVLDTEKLDILHVQMPYSPFMSQRVIKRAYKSAGIIATFHILPSGKLASLGSRLLHLAQWSSLGKLDQVVSVSSTAAAFARQNFGVESIVIPNTIDLAKFRVGPAPRSSNQRIVFLGRLVKRKGCQQLIRAFDLLVQTHQQAELIIAGAGSERPKLEKLVNSLGLQEKVSFLGFIKEDDKPSLLANASIACFPSLYGESFGLVLLEAMAAGTGVVLAGNNPGYATVMEDQPKLLVDPMNTQLMAARLAELLDDKKLASKLHAWQDRHIQQYDISIVGERILAVYQQTIAKKLANSHNKSHAAR